MNLFMEYLVVFVYVVAVALTPSPKEDAEDLDEAAASSGGKEVKVDPTQPEAA